MARCDSDSGPPEIIDSGGGTESCCNKGGVVFALRCVGFFLPGLESLVSRFGDGI